MPCAYYKPKAPGAAESGIAIFVGPDADSKSTLQDDLDPVFDDRLGAGATSMVHDMVVAMRRASEEYNLPMLTFIGADLRPRLAIGGLAMHFVVIGQQVLVVQDPLRESEPVWECLVRAGYSRLPYAPMTPTALLEAPPPDTPRV